MIYEKRLLALLLGCAMMAGSLITPAPTAYAIENSGICGEGFSYTFDSGTGTLTITLTETFDYERSGDNDDDNNNTHTHTPGNAEQENVRAASCVANGSYDEVVYCSGCGQEISRQNKAVPAAGHTWDSGRIVKAATTTENGVKRFACTKCHATRDEAIQKLALKKQTIRVSSKASKTVTYKSSALKKKSASFHISAKAKGKVSYKSD